MQWEYHQCYENLADLPALGSQGWELVAISEKFFYFKRPAA